MLAAILAALLSPLFVFAGTSLVVAVTTNAAGTLAGFAAGYLLRGSRGVKASATVSIVLWAGAVIGIIAVCITGNSAVLPDFDGSLVRLLSGLLFGFTLVSSARALRAAVLTASASLRSERQRAPCQSGSRYD